MELPKNEIIIKGARVNNLKNISVSVPKNKLVVITGLSGSGKSSLAFDTLFAEGQRRYVESLSSYSRQFLGKMDKPEVDLIEGITPAIAIEQKGSNRNSRSTVGTVTEIYDYIKLLYARIGRTFSPVSGKEVKRDSVQSVADFINKLQENTKILIFAPFILGEKRTVDQQLKILFQMGFSRLGIKNAEKELIIKNIAEITGKEKEKLPKEGLILIDRISIQKNDEDFYSRIFDSVQTAFYEGNGVCKIKIDDQKPIEFSNKFEMDGIGFEKINENFFSFNNAYGACPTCEGIGEITGISEDLVVPDKNLSVFDDAIAVWRGAKMSENKMQLLMNAERLKFPVHTPYNKLTKEQKQLLWHGAEGFEGIYPLFKWIESQNYKIQYRVMYSRYLGRTVCPDCEGTRLRKDAGYVKISGKNIQELVQMPMDDLYDFFVKINLDEQGNKIAERLLDEIRTRIKYLLDIGLHYLTLNRTSGTLSGGEAQKIRLATALGSTLMGSMYILDEPSIGLHGRDTQKLISVLKALRDLGNTVIVVEHDEEIINAADHIIDVGYLAGNFGGNIVFEGNAEELKEAGSKIVLPKIDFSEISYKNFLDTPFSLTAAYLSGKIAIPVPKTRRKWKYSINLHGASSNNLKNLNVEFPLNVMTVVTGVSGSGKTSLVKQTLYAALNRYFKKHNGSSADYSSLDGDLNKISDVVLIDQDPIGRSTRSNPITYIGAFDDIRSIFSEQKLSKMRNYKPGFFSFNSDGGRCDVCNGAGEIEVEMQFMANIHLVCDECGGTRYKNEVLDVKYNGKNISDILNLAVDEAFDFFSQNIARNIKKTTLNALLEKLKVLQDVGLSYLKLGQSSSSLSGGESQRLKLAYYLLKQHSTAPLFFIFDEPTTGLHLHDIHKLKSSFDALLEKGHSIIIIEHHPDIIKIADHIIDLGPEGGNAGGHIVFEGSPDDLTKCKDSITGKFLKKKI
ncbi:UvrABC system protein A [Bacteroidia bacterium]|nr:UvrABC system protein A [Bacteroidia bacterium]